MTYGSICSGIEAATVAWAPLGWKAAFYAEIDPFCSALLKHRYPETINYGDFTQIGSDAGPVDVLVGGTPCQSFSVAGLRGGLHDARGNLALEFIELIRRLRPRWVVWENVFGVTSSASHDAPDAVPPHDDLGERCAGTVEDDYDTDEVSDFGVFLSELSECGYGYAWRTLDAQFVGGCQVHSDEFGIGPVPQRRRRIFVVARAGVVGESAHAAKIPDLRRAMLLSGAVLFECESLLWNSKTGREAGQDVARVTVPSFTASGRGSARAGDSRQQDPVVVDVAHSIQSKDGDHGVSWSARGDGSDNLIPFCEYAPDQARTISAGEHQRQDWETCTFVAQETSGTLGSEMARNRGLGLGQCNETDSIVAHSITSGGFDASEDGTGRGTPLVPVLAFQERREGGAMPESCDLASVRASSGGSSRSYVAPAMGVRRLTPVEVERCFGFTEVKQSVTIEVWRLNDSMIFAPAENKNSTGLKSASTVGGISINSHAQYVEQYLQRQDTEAIDKRNPVVLHVEFFLGAGSVLIRLNPEESREYVGNVARKILYQGPCPGADFVRELAHTLSVLDQTAHNGKAESLPSTTSFLPQGHGRIVVGVSGREIAAVAAYVAGNTKKEKECSRSTILQSGLNSQNADSKLKTLCCCVVHAIVSFIPETIQQMSSFNVNVDILSDYTDIPYNGKPASDSVRYRALGNSICIPVLHWIGARIQMVEDL